jgi:hypothetical protein
MQTAIQEIVEKGSLSADQAIKAIAHVKNVEADFLLSAGIRSARAND